MTALSATFSDFRVVKGRKVCQLVFEIPVEAANNALAVLGGVPQPDAEVWVGIARMQVESARTQPVRPKKRFADMGRAQQAGILCGDSLFWGHLAKKHGFESRHYSSDAAAAEGAASFIRGYCVVDSRADLDTDELAGAIWDALVENFDIWAGRMPDPR